MTKAQTHFIILACPFYGHARPTAGLACNLLNLYPSLLITFLIDKNFLPSILKEFAIHKLSPEITADRLRIISIGVDNPPPIPELVVEGPPFSMSMGISLGISKDFSRQFADLPRVLEGVLRGGNVKDAATGEEIETFKEKPTLALVDMFHHTFPTAYAQAASQLNLKETSIPYYCFSPSGLGSHIQHSHWNPKLGHYQHLKTIYDQIKAEKPGSSQEAALHEAFHRTDHQLELIDVAGSPPIHGYEYHPQSESAVTPHYMVLHFMKVYADLMPGAKGSILTLPEEIQTGDGLVEIAETAMFEDTSKRQKMISVGPQFPSEVWSAGKALAAGQPSPLQIDHTDPVIQHLDKMLAQHGTKSVIYISFGSVFFPVKRMDIFEALMSTLESLNMPFVLATASIPSRMAMTPERIAKLEKSGLGLVTPFAPQHMVLAHPATGWFLSHCGSNSLMEAILFGVPLVAWPCMADQPQLAALVAHPPPLGLGIGIELIQIRTGASKGKPSSYGTVVEGTIEAAKKELLDVFTKIKNGGLEKCRENIKKTRQVTLNSWESGASRKGMMAFDEYVV